MPVSVKRVLFLLMQLSLFPHKNSCWRLNGAGSKLSGCGFLSTSSRSERKLSSRADLWAAALPLGSESLFESSSLLHKKKSCFCVVVFLKRLRARPVGSATGRVERRESARARSPNVPLGALCRPYDNKHASR